MDLDDPEVPLELGKKSLHKKRKVRCGDEKAKVNSVRAAQAA